MHQEANMAGEANEMGTVPGPLPGRTPPDALPCRTRDLRLKGSLLSSRGSAASRCSPSVRPSRIAIENALWCCGMFRTSFRMSPSRVIRTAESEEGAGCWRMTALFSGGRGTQRFPEGSRRPAIPPTARSERCFVRCDAVTVPEWWPPAGGPRCSGPGLCVLQALHHHVGRVEQGLRRGFQRR